ncbi:MAG TPA: sensor histidine kinase, partial [Gammaproteobacteria bacterium]|nr:sensor histidine kinase [Gammaproteobacteria bacterium]
DIGMMERVLENLIENALRYTPAGGTVTVSIIPAGDCIHLQVADTGCGIPAADLPHIFDRFYRVEKARQDNGDGAGLGLAIAKRILDLHGSLIEAHSVSGQGTTFRFYLPAWRADLPA